MLPSVLIGITAVDGCGTGTHVRLRQPGGSVPLPLSNQQHCRDSSLVTTIRSPQSPCAVEAQTAAQATALIKLMMSHQSSCTQRGPGNQLSLLGSPSPKGEACTAAATPRQAIPCSFSSYITKRRFRASLRPQYLHPPSTAPHCSALLWAPRRFPTHRDFAAAAAAVPAPSGGRARRSARSAGDVRSSALGSVVRSSALGSGSWGTARKHAAIELCWELKPDVPALVPGLERSRVAVGNGAKPKSSRCSAPHGAQQERCGELPASSGSVRPQHQPRG